jgi:hypothetical protein
MRFGSLGASEDLRGDEFPVDRGIGQIAGPSGPFLPPFRRFPMARALPILQAPFALEDLQIASPCHAEWSDMEGDERVRFCGICEKNVYNLSGMTRQEATALVTDREGSVCIRMFRRTDGTVLTGDCPVGVRAALHRARREAFVAAAAGVAAITALLAFLGGTATKRTCARLDDLRTTIVEQAVTPPPPSVPVAPTMGAAPPPGDDVIMGDVAMPMPTTGSMAAPATDPPVLMGRPAVRPMMGELNVPAPQRGRAARPH